VEHLNILLVRLLNNNVIFDLVEIGYGFSFSFPPMRCQDLGKLKYFFAEFHGCHMVSFVDGIGWNCA
jgi:hypothetical protein